MSTARCLLLALSVALAAGCGQGEGSATSGTSAADIPPIPATHHPKGEDIVVGAVVAATEKSGGIRLNKVVFVDDYPPPLDYEFHMIAYDPKAQTWEEAARMWKGKQVKVIVPHFSVRRTDFMVRDYRVLFVEKVTPEEKAPYESSKRTFPNP
jgi:hypothetical protein